MTRTARDDFVWQAAVGWVMREHEQPLDEPGLAERQAWLDEAPSHLQAYEEARYIWLLTGVIPPSA